MGKLGIIIPIIKFNKFSISAIKKISNEDNYENLVFFFIVSNNVVADELKSHIIGIKNEFKIIVANNYSSNFLRSYAQKVNTQYVFFHDCDDVADYKYLNEFIGNRYIANNEVICFNVKKILLDHDDKTIKEKIIFPLRNYFVKTIETLPTCVYSKIIPLDLIKGINFPNLPFTQDWAISYQLYNICSNHKFINNVVYYYYNYPSSSSQSYLDNKIRLLRVQAYSRNIINEYLVKNKKFEAEFLKFRYNNVLFNRFRRINIIIKPYFVSLNFFLKSNFRTRLSIIFQSMKKICLIIYQK